MEKSMEASTKGLGLSICIYIYIYVHLHARLRRCKSGLGNCLVFCLC